MYLLITCVSYHCSQVKEIYLGYFEQRRTILQVCELAVRWRWHRPEQPRGIQVEEISGNLSWDEWSDHTVLPH